MKLSKKILLTTAIGLTLAGILAAAKSPQRAQPDKVARGAYLVSAGTCTDCHTPHKMGPHGPEPDMTRFLSGHPETAKLPKPPSLPPGPWIAVTVGDTAWSGPWGISYSANLTPDPDTGLGIWTEDMFIKAMRSGKHMGAGRDLLPPMPWRGLATLTDDDLRSIYAYLKTVPPVKNRVPNPVPPGGETRFE
ncbi:MAG TPA: diheme cytochrome c-553 [Verrucomicrobiae bacterium]|nr:diheme cytochrome c-553 [Verrucomicrobiae bacterium]